MSRTVIPRRTRVPAPAPLTTPVPLTAFRNRKRSNEWDVYVFLSYTSRESEVQLVQPLIDRYCRGLWEWADHNGIHIFYDHFALPRRTFPTQQLAAILREAINNSDLMTAFLSPEYISSEWCQFEWITQYFNVCEARMLHKDELRTQTHAIYWKPDIWYELQNGVTSPAVEAILARPDVKATFRETRMTDVTDAYHNPSEIPQAAEQCIHESANVIRQMFPDRFSRFG